MRIGIDISTLTESPDGVSCYLLNLVEHLSLIDGENSYFLYTNRKTNLRVPRVNIKNNNFVLRQSNNSHRLIWMQCQLPFLLKKDRIDVLHSPCYNIPLVSGVPSIVTVHDTTSSLFPEQFVLKHRVIYSTLVPLSAKKASRIIAVSENTKQDIIRLFKIPENKIVAIHEGVNKTFYPRKNDEVDRLKRRYNIEGNYVLFVGTLQPRKNLVYCIKAFNLLKSNRNIEYKLVIAGKKGWFYNNIFRTVRQLNLVSHVVFLGQVPEEDLPLLYSGAGLFIFPSLYEGFGLPPLEAMACVIASDTSCFPEILDKSAVLVDPHNVRQLADEMSKILLDGQLREKMTAMGFERVKQFNWEKTARETLKVYSETLPASGGNGTTTERSKKVSGRQ
jgi:glycosyltransferase involved in cell wall biosynthesis